MINKIILITLFCLSFTSFSQSEQIKFTSKSLGFGMNQHMISSQCENDEPQFIGSLALVSNLNIFDNSAFAAMDRKTLPKEVVDILNLVSLIKSSLTSNLTKAVMLGDLYIKPEFRGQGYAKQLIQHTCREIFNSSKIDYIVLQPIPFEYENNVQKMLHSSPDYETKKESLVKLYESQGFVTGESDTLYMYLERDVS